MARFSVGEAAVICCFPCEYNGQTVTILSGLVERDGEPLSYQITPLKPNTRCYCQPKYLRKIPPPEKTVAWEDCVWRPEHVT